MDRLDRSDMIVTMPAEPQPALTEEGYLAIERKAATKSEFSRGKMVAMAGAKGPHNKIAYNFSVAVGRRLSESCSGYTSDMKVRTNNGAIYYPDVVYTCGEESYRDSSDDVLLDPVVVVEVLSRSTSAKDRGEKRQAYQTIPSLKAYLLISQERVEVDVHLRSGDGWTSRVYHSPSDVIDLTPLDAQVPLAEIYRRVLPKTKS